LLINLRKHEKSGEGSLHPQPKGWGIRDPPHSLSIKDAKEFLARIEELEGRVGLARGSAIRNYI